jgi:predicted DCC family thiol-disulfide oxidoreductase YuxK
VLIYDGKCGFCTICARWAAERGATVVSSRDTDLGAFGLSEADIEKAAWWIGDGVRARGHLAIARTLIEIGGPYALLGRALQLPAFSWLARPGYWLVARYRYKLGWFARFLQRHTQN